MDGRYQGLLVEWFHEYGTRAKLTREGLPGGLSRSRDVSRHRYDRGVGYSQRELHDGATGGAIGRWHVREHEVAVLGLGFEVGQVGDAQRVGPGHPEPFDDQGPDEPIRLQHQHAAPRGTRPVGGQSFRCSAYSSRGELSPDAVTAGFLPRLEYFECNTR